VDLDTVASYRSARDRADLSLAPGERLLAGGTWLFSEPQPDVTGLVDLTTMGWPAIEEMPDGLRVAATCSIAELAALAPRPGWEARPLVRECANALLMSFKVAGIATVGGNICRAFAAAAMVHLAVALDATAVVWTPDGGQYRQAVADLITGNGTHSLADGEVLRAIEIPLHALRARTAFRKIALAALGRSGAVVSGRVDDDGAAVFAITAATARPTVLRYPALPTAARLRNDATSAGGYYSDPLGAADWRRGVTAVLIEEIRAELAGEPGTR
jgi:CO/xanthine dehydrogenase FAD-binding subunit